MNNILIGGGEVISFLSGDDGLEFTGERYVPEVQGQIAFEHLHRYIFAIQMCSGGDVLDIACGEGYGAAALATRARKVLGVDLCPRTIEHADSRYEMGNLEFRQGSIQSIPADNASFDMVVCLETLEHVSEQEQALKEIHRVLRPEGVLIISTPNREARDGAWHDANPFHKKELNGEELRALLTSSFQHVAMMEQRFLHGSILLSQCDEGSTQLIRNENLRSFNVSKGSLGNYYFLAVASNTKLPLMPRVSVFDGGPQLSAATEQFVYAVNTMHAQEKKISLLSEQLQLANTRVELQKIQLDAMRKQARESAAVRTS